MKLSQEGSRKGPVARFSDAHIFAALSIIHREGVISRGDLADELGLGEGSTRNILNTMEGWKQINIQRKGVSLTPLGRETVESIPMRYVSIDNPKYVKGDCQQGVLVKGMADRIRDGMEQRDTGIRLGSDGASVFVMRGGKIIFPNDYNVDTEDPEFAKKIRSTGIEEGDVLIIAGSDDPSVSMIAAAGIGLALI